MATAVKKNAKTPAFESSLSKLEEIIEHLESDDLSLDAALGLFEEGVGLMRLCDGHLRGARGRLSELARGEGGELVTRILGESLESFTGGESIDG